MKARARRSAAAPNAMVRVPLVEHLGKAAPAILSSTTSQVGSVAVTSALGFVYWWTAARLFPPRVVGFAAAAVSAMTLLGTLGVLGFGTLLIGELPRHKAQARAFVMAALLLAGGAGAMLGILFAFVAPHLSADLQPLASSVASVALFGLGVGLTAMTLVLDQALLGLLRGQLQFGRNTVFAAVKLGALAVVGLVPAHKMGLTIYATWVVGLLVSLAGVGWIAFRRDGKRGAYRPQWHLLRGLGRAAIGHHMLNLALQAPSIALPLVVTGLASAVMNAYFYATWMLAGFVFVVPFALTISLYAVGAATPQTLRHKVRLTLGLALSVGALANAILFVSAGYILHLFGPAYAAHAAWSLRFLGLGVFPLIVKDHYVAIRRIHSHVSTAALGMIMGSILELVLAALGLRIGGLAGLSLGWVAAVSLEATFMVATVYRAARGHVSGRPGRNRRGIIRDVRTIVTALSEHLP